jgi:hypothetical protein
MHRRPPCGGSARRGGLFAACLFLATVPESTTFVGIPASAAARGRVAAPLVCVHAQRYNSSIAASQFRPRRTSDGTSKLDAMRARAGVLRTRIRTQQEELQDLEQTIEKMTMRTQRIGSSRMRASRGPVQSFTRTLDRSLTRGLASRWVRTFTDSVAVLIRKLRRVRDREGPNNAQWRSVGQYAVSQTVTATRIVGALVKEPRRLSQLLDPAVPSLIPHMPAILARLDKLETHVAEILEKVLNNRRHLAAIEPYLEGILERFDDIEPHLPWILKNIDVLGPYTGLLLKHIDELLLYARIDETEGAGSQYALAEQLLPHLEFYVSRLDKIGPHLPLIRPHIEKLLKHDRIAKISARGQILGQQSTLPNDERQHRHPALLFRLGVSSAGHPKPLVRYPWLCPPYGIPGKQAAEAVREGSVRRCRVRGGFRLRYRLE